VVVSPNAATVVLPPLPREDASSKFFWDGVRQHKLLILQCQDCGRYIHWPRPICRYCLSEDLVPVEMSGNGSIYSYTVARQAFHPWFADRLPYVIAVIELVEERGLRMLSNVIDCATEDVRVGSDVEIAFRQVSADLTLPLFRLRNA
jgi:uncharacterized protein